MADANAERTLKVVAGGSMAETVGGIAAVVLSILGLMQMVPLFMASAATIVVGAALLLEGAAIASRYTDLTTDDPTTMAEGRYARSELSGSMSAEFLGGAAGIVLGILALVGVAPLVVLSVGVILFGGSLMAGGNASSRLNAMTGAPYAEDRQLRSMRTAVDATASSQALIGIASIVLGVLALLRIEPLTLVLVALLAIGASILLNGAAVSTKMFAMFRR